MKTQRSIQGVENQREIIDRALGVVVDKKLLKLSIQDLLLIRILHIEFVK
jgi:hypothetical protein